MREPTVRVCGWRRDSVTPELHDLVHACCMRVHAACAQLRTLMAKGTPLHSELVQALIHQSVMVVAAAASPGGEGETTEEVQRLRVCR